MRQGATTAGLGEKLQQSFIPTPDATKAKDIEYDSLYPKVFSSPATYIRFSSTVEESVGVPYCMDERDVAVLTRINEGKDINGNSRKGKLDKCTEDAFEEVMSFFEKSCSELQPFADIDKSPVPSLDEMEQNIDESLTSEAQRWLKLLYPHWMSRKNSRPIMPTVKLRLLDNTSEADDADPYVCFRRREVRQTRKTRGRDAQIVEKLKKLRIELETARTLVTYVNQREQLNKQSLETNRKVFEERGKLKKVKSERGIIGEKGEDEELLVNQRVSRPLLTDVGRQLTDFTQPAPKPKARQGTTDTRAPTIKLPGQQRPSIDRQTTENELPSLEEQRRETFDQLEKTVDTKKQQHLNWNKGWEDRTWQPITPPAESTDERPKWGFLPSPQGASYPTPPPTLPSEGSQKDGDTEMPDVSAPPSPPQEPQMKAGASPEPEIVIRTMPGAWPKELSPFGSSVNREATPACRLRRGRGGIMHLEARKQRLPGLCRMVVTDSDDSDEEMDDYFAVSDAKIFDYRTALNGSVRRPETATRPSLPGGAVQAAPVQPQPQRVASSGNAG
jgi:enhancer of polycomb-like protein